MSRTGLRVLIVGSGGREHAIAWKLRKSPRVGPLFIAPGNAGTAPLGHNVDIAPEDIDGLLQFALAEKIDLTVVGPEVPLINGIADQFQSASLAIFGPTASAARIEGSKAWAKDLMVRHGIPTGGARRFTNAGEAIKHARGLSEASYVLKADGPAAGKGVILPESHAEAETAIRGMIDEAMFGASGSTLLIEERLNGPEVSVFAFVQRELVSPEIAACDYKRAYDDDQGPNTGGVGAYSPPEMWSDDLAATVRSKILEPFANAMVAEGCPYSGFIYAGLMLTTEGPKVIEFNCRFGDPEAQAIIPGFDGDLAEVFLEVATGTMDPTKVRWANGCTAAVVVTSNGYPGHYDVGKPITGLKEAEMDAIVFHAGTRFSNGSIVTSGGRVLTCVGLAEDMRTARGRAYAAAGKIIFEGAYRRSDIAARAS